jgi:hypothetical protein
MRWEEGSDRFGVYGVANGKSTKPDEMLEVHKYITVRECGQHTLGMDAVQFMGERNIRSLASILSQQTYTPYF